MHNNTERHALTTIQLGMSSTTRDTEDHAKCDCRSGEQSPPDWASPFSPSQTQKGWIEYKTRGSFSRGHRVTWPPSLPHNRTICGGSHDLLMERDSREWPKWHLWARGSLRCPLVHFKSKGYSSVGPSRTISTRPSLAYLQLHNLFASHCIKKLKRIIIRRVHRKRVSLPP